MKKLSLIVVSLLLTMFAYSQPTFHKIVKATRCEFKNDKWVDVETKYVSDMFVIIDGFNITVGTAKYRTYGDYEKSISDDHTTFTWKCVNSDGKSCYFMMKQFKPEVTTHWMYSFIYTDESTMFEYECED